jgi:uncharacterized protein YbbC (DUF1343 family)
MTYPATVFGEALPAVDVGRGTNMGFRVFGAPFINAREIVEKFNAERIPGVLFHPHTYVPAQGSYKDTVLQGVKITVLQPYVFHPVWTSIVLLDLLGPSVWQTEGARPEWFDQLYGGPALRQALQARVPREVLKTLCTLGHEEFLATRKAVLHY